MSLLEEAPFEVLSTTKDQPVKSKVSKETKAKNITFIPVPDSGKWQGSCTITILYFPSLGYVVVKLSRNKPLETGEVIFLTGRMSTGIDIMYFKFIAYPPSA